MDFNLPIKWNDYEDIAIALFEKFGTEFFRSKNLPNSIYRTHGMGA